MRDSLKRQLHAIGRRARHADAELVALTPGDAAALYDAVCAADWAGDRIADLTREVNQLRAELLAARGFELVRQLEQTDPRQTHLELEPSDP